VHDHPALAAAASEADRVLPVFVLDDRLLGGRFPSPPRAWFLRRSLEALRDALGERGGDLVTRLPGGAWLTSRHPVLSPPLCERW
jgi:deoxyribodipyrimidine photo-lyase